MLRQFILSISFISCIVFGQSTFQVIIEKNDSTSPDFSSHSITETENGNIFAVGKINPGGWYAKNRLIKLDSYGNVLWDTTYKHTPAHEFFPEVIPAHDGGVILASLSMSYPINDKDSTQDILIWKINEEGLIEWQKVLSAVYFIDMVKTSDGGYLILGESREQESHLLDIVTYKLDVSGNLVWSKYLGDIYKSEGGISIKQINETIYVCGDKSPNGWSDIEGLLLAMDTKGNTLWTINIPNSPEYEKVRVGTVFALNGRYYFEATDGMYEFIPNTGEYWPVQDSLPIAVLGVFNKGYNFESLCGTDQLNLLSGASVFYLQKYDNLLEPYYEKHIPEISGTLIEVIFTRDNGMLVLNSANESMQITKTDCMGNVDHWSDECKSKIPERNELLIYPNPSSDEIRIDATFDFDEVVFYSVNGQYVSFENPCKCPRQTIDVTDLSAGVYEVRISSTEQFATSRFVKL